jgi:hypothetical protein
MREPYEPLHGGSFSGPAVAESPDPLIGYRWSNPQAADALQVYALGFVDTFTETPAAFQKTGGQDGSSETGITVVGAGSLRFDFGVESAAWLEFDSPDMTGTVEMSISEYDEPAVENTGPKHRIKTAAPIRYGDTYRLELNAELYEGVRFGWIHVRSFERPWHITAVRAVCQVKPANYNGSFACSDPMLTRIWYTGAYVVKANLCKDYFGAILMDRGDRISWTGDAHPAQAAALAAFGNWDFIRQNLERTASSSNGIESYSMYWVLSLVEYFQHTGDASTMEKYIDHACSLLEHGKSIYADPPISFYGWDERLGAGFEAPDCFETKSAYRMLFLRACEAFAAVMEATGRTQLSEQYRELARHKIEELRMDKRWPERLGVHALADAINTGLMSDAEQDVIFAQGFSNRLNRLSYSPFNQYFLLQAMTRMKRFDEALITVHDIWGGQIEYGGTMFFETYAPSWNQCVPRNGAVPNCQAGYTSLAHPWGAGVTAWLSREVLGIRPAAPGFAKVDIMPRLGRALTWVSGTLPTPHGPVSLHFDKRSGSFEVTLPEGVTGQVHVPREERTIHRIMLGGQLVWDGTFHPVAGVGAATADAAFVTFSDLQPGQHAFKVSYSDAPQSLRHAALPQGAPLSYPIPHAKEDRSIGGNWGGRYGRDGYVLFDYDGPHQDRRQLPRYVRAVQASSRKNGGCLHGQPASSTEDMRALAPSRANELPRKVGQLYTGDPIACQQTMTVDVEVVDGSRYHVALYCLDWEKQGRRQAIELFDLKNLNRLAPVHVVDKFAQGAYVLYTCNGSVRFRINQIRGPNAVLNAIFFDRQTALRS